MPAFAGTFYVRTDGNDVNPGTENIPSGAWATIQKAADTLKAGDTAEIQSGTYKEAVKITTSGTPEQYIVFRASGEVVVTAEGPSIKLDGASYVRIEGITCKSTTTSGISLVNSNNNILVRNVSSGKGIEADAASSNNQLAGNIASQNSSSQGISTTSISIVAGTSPLSGSSQIPIVANATGGSISGKVTLQSRTNHQGLITFGLTRPGESVPFMTHEVTTASDGSYTLNDVPAGVYNLSAKHQIFLSQNKVLIEVVEGQVTPNVNFNILGGDCDNNNVVSGMDFAILKAAYGTRQGDAKWDPRADFNGNGQIDGIDFSILRANYSKSGIAPQITITSPQNGYTSTTQPITIQGTINNNTAAVAVKVNDEAKATPAVENGTFTAVVPLILDSNTIVAVATDPAGNQAASNSIIVTYQPGAAPIISSITPVNGSTFTVGDTVNIQVTATDPNSYPLEYEFLVNGEIKQDWSSSSTYAWVASPTPTFVSKVSCHVRNNQGAEASEDLNYNVQIDTGETTPPPAPTLTTNSQSDSLDSITAQWSSTDPASGIMEYQYAIGTTPGGTDVVYWTTYGNDTQASISGLNLTKGSQYYLSVVAKNGAGLKSSVTTSGMITAQKEPYVKITYPYENALITSPGYTQYTQIRVKGTAEGVSQITVNGKTVTVNPDGTFTGPLLVAPGYAKWNNISNDNDHIIMNFPGPTTITASANGQEDTATFYYYQVFIKTYCYYNYYPGGALSMELRGWNYDALTECPFSEFYPTAPRYRFGANGQWEIPDGGREGTIYINRRENFDAIPPSLPWSTSGAASFTIHTPPAINGDVKPMIITFGNCEVRPSYGNLSSFPNISNFTVNGMPLVPFYGNGNWSYAGKSAYVVINNYQPDTDLPLDIECPIFTANDQDGTYDYQGMGFQTINLVTLDTVREIPYGSGNYVPVKTIPIFQPDSGVGRGPSAELTNMPFLTLKFNEVPSNLQIDTLQASMRIASAMQTFNLTETAANSGIFTEPTGIFSLQFTPASINLNPNIQDELTCSVTSAFGNLNNKFFNLKESASDSLYFNDVKTFVTVTFNNELTSYQVDTLAIQYDNGMTASKETLTETAADSLIFSNEDSTFTVNLNNCTGTLPESLDITINNTDYLEISKAKLQLPKVHSNPYVYTNESMDGGSDLPPNNPLDDGSGVFKIKIVGMPYGGSATIGTDTESVVLELTDYGDPRMSQKFVLLPEGDTTTYDGVTCLHSSSGEGKLTIKLKDSSGNTVIEKVINARKAAFIGGYVPGFKDTVKGNLNTIKKILVNLGYTTNVPDEHLTKQHFKDALPNYSVWYILTHGSVITMKDKIFTSIHVAKDEGATSSQDGEIFPSDVLANIGGNSYKFIFLNGCYTADKKPGSATVAFRTYFNATEYVGWNGSPGTVGAAGYAQSFFGKLSEKNATGMPITVKQAYDSLTGYKIPSLNDYFIPILLHGSDARYLGDGTTDIQQ